MGKGYYLGGHTKINIYDEERTLIKKIYRALYDDIKKYHITYAVIKKCFADYDLIEVAEAAEFNLAEKEKFLEILIDFHKKHNNIIINEEETIEKKKIQKYSLSKNDYVEGLEYDLKKLREKIKKHPTNESLKEEEKIIKRKIMSLGGKGIESITLNKKTEQIPANKKVKSKKKNQKEKIEKITFNTHSNMYLALKNSGIIKE